jgi:hypothetical protein
MKFSLMKLHAPIMIHAHRKHVKHSSDGVVTADLGEVVELKP